MLSVFLPLLIKVLPLYALILLGYISRRYLEVDSRSLARLVIYLISPVIVFHSGFSNALELNVLALPLIFCGVVSTVALLSTLLARFFFKDSTRSLYAFASGNSNTGYFGLPVLLALMGQDILSLAVLTSLGSILYENSLGVFLLARGHYSVKDSFKKVLRLPAIYALVAGLLLNALNLQTDSSIYIDFIGLFKGTYVILGMMIIGSGIASIQRTSFDQKLLSLGFFSKFGLTPLVMGVVLFFVGSWISPEAHDVLWILSLCPVAANTVAYAHELKIFPEKAATLVFLSTIFAMFYIPLMVGLL